MVPQKLVITSRRDSDPTGGLQMCMVQTSVIIYSAAKLPVCFNKLTYLTYLLITWSSF